MATYRMDISPSSVPDSDRRRRHSDLFFDVVIRYVSVASGLLSALSLGGELFFFRGVSCSDTSSETQAAFINKWCSNRHLGPNQVFSYVLALQGILIYFPSLLWNRAFAARFTSFFADVDSISRWQLRFGSADERMIPELYASIKWDIYSRRMLGLYITKLVAQVVLTLSALVFFVLFFDVNHLLSAFTCDLDKLSLNVTVECIFPAGSSLQWTRSANFIVLSAGFIFACVGLIWTFGPRCRLPPNGLNVTYDRNYVIHLFYFRLFP